MSTTPSDSASAAMMNANSPMAHRLVADMNPLRQDSFPAQYARNTVAVFSTTNSR